jgi:hypothetical protein
VVANGDTANKVGTYQLAIAAKHHGIPFYVAAPSSSCDLRLQTGQDIIIEERPGQELTDINGVRIAAPGRLSVGSRGTHGTTGIWCLEHPWLLEPFLRLRASPWRLDSRSEFAHVCLCKDPEVDPDILSAGRSGMDMCKTLKLSFWAVLAQDL